MLNSAGTAAGGAVGLVGFVAGQLFDTDTKLVIMARTFKKPVFPKSADGSRMGINTSSTDKDGLTMGGLKVFYKLEKGKEASDDVVLKMAVNQWIKHYIIFDAPTLQAATPAAPVAQDTSTVVSGIASTESINEKK